MADDRLFVQSLQKGLALLEAFSRQPGELSLNELAALSGIDRSSAQRMAHTLLKLGYLERGNNGRGYTPAARSSTAASTSCAAGRWWSAPPRW
ncbi:helix-turn-helix domain-containing protein [Teichococcus aestuarii]|uniref:helix-turn-helix domain-containing protein n=1 Tax=Teichococcus aestuarii TaxID=568898 RepID=UPI003612CEF7